MSRNKFRKTYLHCCDNTNLDETDKWVKFRPLIEATNEKLQQFGIFSSELTIFIIVLIIYLHYNLQ